ncbi:MAG TPA: hypothetical protein VLX92_03655 [Kofleriaceae bacterium]|nr:hypothetical protein [Kofleriaceae bacterium]
MRLALVLSIGCVVACGNKGASESAVRCERAAGVWDRIVAREKATDPINATPPDSLALLKTVTIASCKNDGWSDKLVACVQATSEEPALFDCLHNGLTPDQARALSSEFEQALAKKLMHDHPIVAPVRYGN